MVVRKAVISEHASQYSELRREERSKHALRKGLRSELKFVISVGATKEKTVQVETVPLKSFHATPLTLNEDKISPAAADALMQWKATYLAVPICEPAGPAL